MRQTRFIALPLLVTTLSLSPTVFAAPASYADVIYSERQRMMQNHPHQQQTPPTDEVHRKPINSLTWGWIIKTEHERLKQLYPESNASNSKASPSKSRNSTPTSYGDIIEMQKDRMKQ